MLAKLKLMNNETNTIPIQDLSDEDAIAVWDIWSGDSSQTISDEAKIHQVKELLCTNYLYMKQTNIPPIKWFKAFKYLTEKDYIIE